MPFKDKCFWFIVSSCGMNWSLQHAAASAMLVFMKPADWMGFLFYAALHGALSYFLFANAYSLFKDMVRAVVAENEGE